MRKCFDVGTLAAFGTEIFVEWSRQLSSDASYLTYPATFTSFVLTNSVQLPTWDDLLLEDEPPV
jgi:hypothetical protein